MNKEIIVTIYTDKDVKKSGGFKKKNGVVKMNKEEFFKYLKDFDFKINSQYIDYIGNILKENNEVYQKFKCSYRSFIMGTSAMVKEFNEVKK